MSIRLGTIALGAAVLAVAACGDAPGQRPAATAPAPTPAGPATAAASPTWLRFRDQAAAGQPTDLPDFSYAGYARGEREPPVVAGPVFDVTAFGAKPDDLEDDHDGIAAAIAAAEARGGGVVFLPHGRYLLNTRMAARRPLAITGSGIVLRGEGCGAGGTILHLIHPFDRGDDPRDPARMHLGEALLSVRAPAAATSIDRAEILARVASDAVPGGRTLEVDAPGAIAAGDWVMLWVQNQAVLRAMIAPFEVDPAWTSITEDKARIAELHQVAAVRGRTLEFAEPIRYPVTGRDGWVVRRHTPITGIGIEDICFLGSAHQRYVHHRSDLDDSGWSMIKMVGVADGWVRRCSFINTSQAVAINLSSFVSMLDLVIAGNRGHHGLRSIFYNYGVLGGLVDDRSDATHGPSVNLGAVGTVYWRCVQSPGQPLDLHAGRPYCTLYDACSGGGLYGSGGGLRDLPHHLRNLVVWNLEHGVRDPAAPPIVYDFWRPGKSDCFVLPSIVGIHGAAAEFDRAHLALLESPGTAVEPGSLYEAQLRLRLGAAPEWIARSRAAHAQLLRTPLPAHFTLSDPRQGVLLLPEDVPVADLLRFLGSRSLETSNSRTFAWTVSDPTLTIRTDQRALRDALYALMQAIYRRCRDGDATEAVAGPDGGVLFRLRSGPARDDPAFARDLAVQDATVFAGLIGARVAVRYGDGRLLAELAVPPLPPGR